MLKSLTKTILRVKLKTGTLFLIHIMVMLTQNETPLRIKMFAKLNTSTFTINGYCSCQEICSNI